MPDISDRELRALLAEYRYRRLSETDARWRDSVPEHTERAAQRAFHQMEAAAAAPAAKRVRFPRAAAAAVLAAAVAGGSLAVPAVREGLARLPEAVALLAPARRSAGPGEYVFPSPGAEFSVKQETRTEHLAECWFVSDTQQLLVRAARRLPDEAEDGWERLLVKDLPARVTEEDGLVRLLVYDGETVLELRWFHAGRAAAIAYAEAVIEANELH